MIIETKVHTCRKHATVKSSPKLARTGVWYPQYYCKTCWADGVLEPQVRLQRLRKQ